MPPEHTHTLTKESLVCDKNNLMKFPKEKPSRNSQSKERQDKGGSALQETNQGGKSEDRRCANSPATPHSHAQSREPWEVSDRRNKKGDREGDGNYLSASAVQLKYRKSEQVTEKLMRG